LGWKIITRRGLGDPNQEFSPDPLREGAFTDTARGQFPNGFDSLHLVDAKFEIIQGEK
jgi:hypothetical protein